mgnify:FL=1
MEENKKEIEMKKELYLVSPVGTHLIIDLYDCRCDFLDNSEKIQNLLIEVAKISNTTILSVKVHKFTPMGVSGYVLISESHISIHTWPEFNYASVDIYTCGDNSLPTKGFECIVEKLNSQKPTILKLERGLYAKKFKHDYG